LAIWLPQLSTDRLKRKGAPPSDPLVIAARANNALYIAALSGRAQSLGLYKGQPLANARAMAPHLTVRPADEKADAALLEKIADWCDRFTPFVATDAPDGVVLDITGVGHLFGGEAAMLRLVTEKIRAQGFAVRTAIAGTVPAARALAKFATGHIAAPGAEAESLKRLPVAAFAVEDKIIAALRRAGLKTIGQVAVRGRDELAARFGKNFVAALDILFGREDKPLNPRRPLPDLMAEQRFAEPIVTADAIAASLLSLAQSLSEILERRGLGLRRLEASFFRADGLVRRIGLRLGGASRDPQRVMRLLQEKLDTLHDALDPGFGFDLIRLEAMLAEREDAAESHFDSDANAKREIGYLTDRLAARHGEARILRFVPQDTHIPEARSVGVPAQDDDFKSGPWPPQRGKSDPPLRPLRLFEKPEEIKVPFATAPDGPPHHFRWRKASFEVARAEGPERIAMEWWRKQKPTRDYFRVETKDGQRFWLYRDGLYKREISAPRWYLHGIFA
jgi:protein ImuB